MVRATNKEVLHWIRTASDEDLNFLCAILMTRLFMSGKRDVALKLVAFVQELIIADTCKERVN